MTQNSYQKLTISENIIFDWSTAFGAPPIIQDRNEIEPTADGFYLALPDATLVAVGQSFVFNNVSAFSFKLVAYDLTTEIITIEAGEAVEICLTDTSTKNGAWSTVPFGGGYASISNIKAESSDNTIVITNGDITTPGGTIDFKLPTSISNFNKISAPNFVVVDTIDPLTFKTRELQGSPNVLISQGDGQAGDPVITLNSSLTSLNSINVGNLKLSGDTISNPNTNGNIELVTTGTGDVIINGVTINPSGGISGLTSVKAFSFFTDTLVGDSNLIVNEDNINMTTIQGSAGTYTCKFDTNMTTLNYGVILTLGSTGGELPFISNAYVTVRDLDAVTIIVTDASGELVRAMPYGITVMVISS